MKNSVEALRDKLRTGIPELKVPALEPLEFPQGLPLAHSRDLMAYARNVKLYDIYKFDINSLAVDLDTKKIDLDIHFKSLKLKGDYDVSAKIVVPVNGKGPVEIDAGKQKNNLFFIFLIFNLNCFFFFIFEKKKFSFFFSNRKYTCKSWTSISNSKYKKRKKNVFSINDQ